MTDGGAWRQRDQPGAARADAPAGPAEATSPWWSDARNDPWRDPVAPAIVLSPAAPHEPPPEPPVGRPVATGWLVAVVLVTALLAGALGGALGYTAARHGGAGPGTVLGARGTNVPAQAGRAPDSLAAVVDRVLPSVVTIRSGAPAGASLGSGFIASTDGYVITNDHVVGGTTGPVTVTFHDGSDADATLVGREPEADVAVLKLSRGGLRPVEFGDSDATAVGDPVLAFGSPLALVNTVTSGIVSAVDRPIRAGEPGGQVRYYAAIQTDAAVNQGNSGGPLVDAAGRVIGINSVIRSVSVTRNEAGSIGLAFAIPINQAKRVAQEIIETGQARRTVLGAQLDRGGQATDGGVRLISVVEGGPAADAGLRAGDVLLRLDGRLLSEPADVVALVRKYDPGSVVVVDYRRGSVQENVVVTLIAG